MTPVSLLMLSAMHVNTHGHIHWCAGYKEKCTNRSNSLLLDIQNFFNAKHASPLCVKTALKSHH